MYEIITASTAAHLMSSDYGFSYNGALTLIEYLDETSKSEHGIEFDPIALNCKYNEYETAIEAIEDHSGEGWEGTEQEALEKLKNLATIIKFKNGIIVQYY